MTDRKPESSATSQLTGTTSIGIPPWGSSGVGARRVQITKPSGAGSPEAMPRVKGLVGQRLWARMIDGAPTRTAPPVARKPRRLSGSGDGSVGDELISVAFAPAGVDTFG